MNITLVLHRSRQPEAMVRMSWEMARASAGKLRILCCFEGYPVQPAAPVSEAQIVSGPGLLRQVKSALAAAGAKGVDLSMLKNPDPVAALLSSIDGVRPGLLVLEARGRPEAAASAPDVVDRLFRFAPCDTLLLDPSPSSDYRVKRVLIPMATSMVDSALRFALRLSHQTVPIIPLLVGHDFGADSRVIARRELQLKLKEADIAASDRLIPDVIVAQKPMEGLVRAVREGDMMLIPASSDQILAKFRRAQEAYQGHAVGDGAVGIFRPYREERLFPRLMARLPKLSASDRVRIFDQLILGARINPDYLVMMGVATAIAALGLLQNSGAVVIGAMLVAPLMTPLIGAGFALIQGNIRLFRESLRSVAVGIACGLLLSILIGLASPAEDLTAEIMARTSPSEMDLLVAFFSGLGAAYAFARPGLAGTLAGVAIAAALVPPLATVGIGIARGIWGVATGAAVLHLTNLVAISLGAATAFRILGVQGIRLGIGMALWARRVILLLALLTVMLSVPLGYQSAKTMAEGQNRPMAYPLSSVLYSALKHRVEQESGMAIIMAGRSSFTEKGIKIGIMVASEGAVAPELIKDLRQIVMKSVGADAEVSIYAVQRANVKQ